MKLILLSIGSIWACLTQGMRFGAEIQYVSREGIYSEVELEWDVFPSRGEVRFKGKEGPLTWNLNFFPSYTVFWKSGDVERWMAKHHLQEQVGNSPLQWRDLPSLLVPWCEGETVTDRLFEGYSRVKPKGHEIFPDTLNVKAGRHRKEIIVEEFKPVGRGKIPSIFWVWGKNKKARARVSILKQEPIQNRQVF